MRVASRGASGRQQRARGRVAARKRAFDIVVGGALALIALPVIIVLAVGVALSLRAWPFFVQRRPGWRGRSLTIVKLRTLPTATPVYADKHALGIAQMQLPWLCALLRRTHLDELPQLFSVVLGHMSLVGPRPALPSDVEPLGADFEALRRSVRPGCTGLWQLSVASGDTATSAPRFDTFYVNYASTLLDLWIVVRTVGWILGMVEPIEVSDVPAAALGPGLLARSWVHRVADESSTEDEPSGWRRPKVPASSVYPPRPVHAARSRTVRDQVLAEVGD